MPISKLRILFFVKAVIVPPTFIALFLWAAIVTHGGGELVTGQMKLTSPYMNTAYSTLTGLNVIIGMGTFTQWYQVPQLTNRTGLFSSMAVNIPVCIVLTNPSLHQTNVSRIGFQPLLQE